MEPLHLLHLVLLCAWGGVVLVEAVIELSGRRGDTNLRQTALEHYRIDLWVELPLILGVLVSGALLSARAWPLSPLHWTKIGAGLGAMALNLWCVAQVIRRHQRADDGAALQLLTRRVVLSAMLGMPLGIIAAALGVLYFRA